MDKESIYPLIKEAIRVHGTLKEPFTSRDVRRIAKGWPYGRYFSYLAYHCTENKSASEALYVRVDRGKYKLAE